MKMKSKADVVFDVFNIILMTVLLFIMFYPLYFTVIVSVSEPTLVAKGFVTLYPKGFTLEAYQNVFSNAEIWTGYLNTIEYTVLGTLFSLFLTMPAAYVLSKKNLHGHTFLTWYFLFTMYFSGGLVPTYFVVRDLHMINTRAALIILTGVSVYNMVVTRMYFQTSIPGEIYESARMDGASEFRMFFQIALPLAKPIIAVMTLFYAVGQWNDFFLALVYTTDKNLSPLQLVLRRILILNESIRTAMKTHSMSSADISSALRRALMAESMKYALIFISSAPLLIAYPFVQKFFIKGIMIGSLKG